MPKLTGKTPVVQRPFGYAQARRRRETLLSSHAGLYQKFEARDAKGLDRFESATSGPYEGPIRVGSGGSVRTGPRSAHRTMRRPECTGQSRYESVAYAAPVANESGCMKIALFGLPKNLCSTHGLIGPQGSFRSAADIHGATVESPQRVRSSPPPCSASRHKQPFAWPDRST